MASSEAGIDGEYQLTQVERRAAHAASGRRMTARLGLAADRVRRNLSYSYNDVGAKAWGVTNSVNRVGRVLRGDFVVPTDAARQNIEDGDDATGGNAGYGVLAALHELAKDSRVLDMTGTPDLLEATHRVMAVDRMVNEMLQGKTPTRLHGTEENADCWWLHPCPESDLEAAAILAERLLWGFVVEAIEEDEDEDSEPTELVSGVELLSDDALATKANSLLAATAATKYDQWPEQGALRLAILSRQVLDGYRTNPQLRVEQERFINRLLSIGWDIEIAFSREGDSQPDPLVRADFVDLLLSDLNFPGALIPLVDLKPDIPDGIYAESVGYLTILAVDPTEKATAANKYSVITTLLDPPGPDKTIDLALKGISPVVSESVGPVGIAGSPAIDDNTDSAEQARRGQSVHHTIERYENVSLEKPSEALARFSMSETAGKLDEGPRYIIGPGPSQSLVPQPVTNEQIEAWLDQSPSNTDEENELVREIQLTRWMKNQALRRHRRSFVHRHIIPLEGLTAFLAGEYGPGDRFNNPIFGNRYLTPDNRDAIKQKLLTMLEETIANHQNDPSDVNRGFFLALPDEELMAGLAELWATVTVGVNSGSGQVHLLHRTPEDLKKNTAVLASLSGFSLTHFQAPKVFMGFLDLLWRYIPYERTDPEAVYQIVEKLRTTN